MRSCLAFGRRIVREVRDAACRHSRARKIRRRIGHYLSVGQRPWSVGYGEYKERLLRELLAEQRVLAAFKKGDRLPVRFGYRVDERVVEYPWLFSRIGGERGLVLDAGSALNFEFILDHSILEEKNVVIYNLSPEHVVTRDNVSYVYGDLRQTILRGESCDEIVCISTLEHVGMDNTLLYSRDSRLNERDETEYLRVIDEFGRILKPGGHVFITVPFGRKENHRWLQQFDEGMIADCIARFGGDVVQLDYYKYVSDGWQLSDEESCRECRYFDIHAGNGYESDYVAAARAVCCLELLKRW